MAGEKNIPLITLENIAKIKLNSERETLSHGEKPGLAIEKEGPEIKKIEVPESVVKPSVSPAPQVQSYQSKRTAEIDSILSEGLHEVFLKMGPLRQKEFKLAGEETVAKISILLDKSKVRASKVIDLIINWLKLIPGVNKFFVEQEAKIKADKIMNIKN